MKEDPWVTCALVNPILPTNLSIIIVTGPDGIKLLVKETIIPLQSNNWIFLVAPFLTFYLALVNWIILPLEFGIAISEIVGGGILIIIAISELTIYGVILSGCWVWIAWICIHGVFTVLHAGLGPILALLSLFCNRFHLLEGRNSN
jgi:hypothetical protein